MKSIFLFCYLPITLFLFSCEGNISDLGILVPPTVDQDPSLPSVSLRVAGITRKVHVRTYGNPSNPVLFILHGTYTDTRPYRNLGRGLSDRYFVVIWDQRGCGLSERIAEAEFTLETAVKEINQMKEYYSPSQPISLIGQSWGGGLATLYTSQYPERVSQLVLMEPMPLTQNDMQEVYQDIVDFSYWDASWNDLARHSEAISPNDHAQLDYRAMMILRSTMTANYHCNGDNPPAWPIHRVGGFIEYVRNKRLGNPVTGFTYDFTEGIENYADTVLILGGSCSSLGYTMQVGYSQPHFPHAEVVEISPAGHRMNIEQYELVMATLTRFLHEY